MRTADRNAVFAATLVDEWARAGVAEACLAPGSRSTPLALALGADLRIRVHVHLDERSAAYFALGAAKASGRPVVVLCTSGTAAANFHPAVLEAFHSRSPLLVATADRPPELRHTGANQTVDQHGLFGPAVRWTCEVGAPSDHPGAGGYWRSVGARSASVALGPPAGPVHLNLAFREPLLSAEAQPAPAPAPGRADGAPWVRSVGVGSPALAPRELDDLAEAVAATERGLVVAGWGSGCPGEVVDRFAEAAGWPVLADPLSGARRGRLAVSTYEALLRCPAFAAGHRPDLVLRLGAAPTSRLATEWLDVSVRQVVIDADSSWNDPLRAASLRVATAPEATLESLTQRLRADGAPTPAPSASGPGGWLGSWLDAEGVAREVIDRLLDSWSDPFEGRVARDLVACLPDGAAMVVASSMPVRDVEAFARPRAGLSFFANRGVSGIDGLVSTTLGVAAVHPGPTVGLLGDLAFLHDSNGLLGAARRPVDATLVVVDNDGGGIFSFLPQRTLPADRFEALFGTPHGLDLLALSRLHGLPTTEVGSSGELVPAVLGAVCQGGVQVVVVRSDRATNLARHRLVWEAVAEAVARPI